MGESLFLIGSLPLLVDGVDGGGGGSADTSSESLIRLLQNKCEVFNQIGPIQR